MKLKIFYYSIIIVAIVFFSTVGASAGYNQGHPVPSGPSQSVQLDEIVVSGDRIEDFMQQNPHQVVGLNAEEIEKRHFIDAYEALSTLPGVDIKPSPTGGARISIRGSGGSGQVLILIDGRPMNTSQYSGVDLSGISMDIIKSITVFKPPAPVWLGPGSSAGAICIETKTGGQGKSNAGSYKVKFSGGSYGLFDGSCSGKISSEKQNTLIAAGYFHTDGKWHYHYEGDRDKSEKDTGSLSVNWDYKTDNATQYQINGKYYHTEHSVSAPLYKSATPNARQEYDKGSMDVKIKGPAGEKADYDMKLYGDVIALEDRANAGDIYNLDLYKTGLASEIVWSNLLNGHDLRLGGFAEYIHIDHTADGEHHRSTLSLHAEHTRRFDRFSLISGARGDYSNDFDLSPAANIGIHVRLAQSTILKSSVGYSVNLPSFGQLYQSSHGAWDQSRGNPDLSEEKIVSAALGVEHTIKKNNIISLSLFRTDTDDLIKYQRGNDDISRPENIGKAWKQGIEASVKINPLKSLTVDMNYILQDTENEDNGKELSYDPTHQGKVTVKYVLPVKTRLEMIGRAYSHQFTDIDNTDSEKIGSYTTFDVKVVQPLTLFSYTAECFAHIINLFDRDYEVHYGYPDDGFRVTAGMAVNF